MFMFLLFLTFSLTIAGIIVAIFAWRGEGHIIAMRETETLNIAQVVEQHRMGRLGQTVEVVGTSECEMPLRAPYSSDLCLAFEYVVNEEHERNVGHGGFRTRHHGGLITNHGREISSNHLNIHAERVPRFYVHDASGRIMVETQGAKIDLLESMARFESYTGIINDVEREIWREEHNLPVGNRVYVLATLGDVNGEPVLMRHPIDPQRSFLISYRDEQSYLNHTRLRTYGLYILSGVLISAAVISGILLFLKA
ncbi:GIDE domain-containing protein [Candidatus Oscillochloris fontis]|uniref:GIDE domain-containing protein n=1 Tax=Candidatus Oscillochloris fontis TaxID=2496868 RepID=UPI00101CCB8D|nr:GIDE domain-containing protein [Candidatus Oscillochloris fontis]